MDRKFLLLVILLPALSFALPKNKEFKELLKQRTLVLRNCALFEELDNSKLRINKRGRRIFISLPRSLNRERYHLKSKPKPKYFACGEDELTGRTILYARVKRRAVDSTFIIDLKKRHFPKKSENTPSGNLAKQCDSIKEWNSSFIYKTIGSGHFSPSDPRRYSIGLIFEHGAKIPIVNCIYALATNGEVVGSLGLYAAHEHEYFARYYGGTGCGSAISGSALASKARSEAGSSNVYMQIGSTCYGPIAAERCVNSSSC